MIEQLEYQASLDIISEAERQVLDSLRPMVEQLIDDAAGAKMKAFFRTTWSGCASIWRMILEKQLGV